MRHRAAVAAVVAAAAGCGVAAPVHAGAQFPARPVVEQGMKIRIDQGNGLDSVCTVGHNDPGAALQLHRRALRQVRPAGVSGRRPG